MRRATRTVYLAVFAKPAMHARIALNSGQYFACQGPNKNYTRGICVPLILMYSQKNCFGPTFFSISIIISNRTPFMKKIVYERRLLIRSLNCLCRQ